MTHPSISLPSPSSLLPSLPPFFSLPFLVSPSPPYPLPPPLFPLPLPPQFISIIAVQHFLSPRLAFHHYCTLYFCPFWNLFWLDFLTVLPTYLYCYATELFARCTYSTYCNQSTMYLHLVRIPRSAHTQYTVQYSQTKEPPFLHFWNSWSSSHPILSHPSHLFVFHFEVFLSHVFPSFRMYGAAVSSRSVRFVLTYLHTCTLTLSRVKLFSPCLFLEFNSVLRIAFHLFFSFFLSFCLSYSLKTDT